MPKQLKPKKVKQKPNKPKPIPKRRTRTGISEQLVRQVCSITDPWCHSAKGARWPDESQQPSLAFQMRSMISLSTAADGTGCIAFIPGYTYQYSIATSFSGVAFTMGPLVSFNATSLNPQRARLISVGFKIHNILPPLTTSGMLYIRQFAISGGALTALHAFSFRGTNVSQIALKDVHGQAFTLREFSDGAHWFHVPFNITPDSSIYNYNSPGWNIISFALEGAPATSTPLEIEVVYNWELIFDDGDANSLMMTTPPPPNTVAINTSRKVSADPNFSMFPSVANLENFVANTATKLLRRAAETFIPGASTALAIMVD